MSGHPNYPDNSRNPDIKNPDFIISDMPIRNSNTCPIANTSRGRFWNFEGAAVSVGFRGVLHKRRRNEINPRRNRALASLHVRLSVFTVIKVGYDLQRRRVCVCVCARRRRDETKERATCSLSEFSVARPFS